MRRVVVTGMGIWSCIGQDLQTVIESLKQGRSGIIFDPKRIEYGLQSGLVGNVPRPDIKPFLPRKFRATMSLDAEYAYMTTRQALEQAGVSDSYLRLNDVGIIWGSEYMGGEKEEYVKIMNEEKNSLLLGPSALFKTETSSVSMNLSGVFNLRGISLCMSAACASSAYAIGLASTFIRSGTQDMIIVGGANDISLIGSALMDAVDGRSVSNNPLEASRPFDKKRDGLVSSGGGAALILEEYNHALNRGIKPLVEIIGVGFATDGQFFLGDKKTNIVRSMLNAIADAHIKTCDIDYINSSASGGILEDVCEARALNELFAGNKVMIGSTESITGHEHHMAGASETIYTALMLLNDFIAPTVNLTDVIDEAKDLNIVRHTIYQKLNTALINNTGLGGVNTSLIISKL